MTIPRRWLWPQVMLLIICIQRCTKNLWSFVNSKRATSSIQTNAYFDETSADLAATFTELVVRNFSSVFPPVCSSQWKVCYLWCSYWCWRRCSMWIVGPNFQRNTNPFLCYPLKLNLKVLLSLVWYRFPVWVFPLQLGGNGALFSEATIVKWSEETAPVVEVALAPLN